MNQQENIGFKSFASLIHQIGVSTKTNDKLSALVEYFATAEDRDKVWTIALFSGRKPRRFVSPGQLQLWCNEITSYPAWLFSECYHTVGDLSETIALLLPGKINDAEQTSGHSLSSFLEQFIQLSECDEETKKGFIIQTWHQLDQIEKFVFNKLISGNFRIGVSQQLVVNALAKVFDLTPPVVAHRISGNWDPSSVSFKELLHESSANLDASKPYPFYLAYPVEDDPTFLGNPYEWQAEWKWDGIRGQIIKRNGHLFIWSRGEELITDKFPELQNLKDLLPDGLVLDGEILSIRHNPEEKSWIPLPFSTLQTRIGRKNVSKKQLQEAPVGFVAYDLLELNYVDYRENPMYERRLKLVSVINQLDQKGVYLSPEITFESWESLAQTRATSREMNAEGIMLKRKSSAYQSGRKRGDWWKWKIEPMTIDAVMIYAQKGSGRRSNLYTDYTFAVRDGENLVPFAKAYSGLTDKEFAQVDAFVKRNSIEKFGPVRTVKPELVFELAFEGIAKSNRHKSGVALRFPRMSRWRKDKPVNEINTLADLKDMLRLYGNSSEPA